MKWGNWWMGKERISRSWLEKFHNFWRVCIVESGTMVERCGDVLSPAVNAKQVEVSCYRRHPSLPEDGSMVLLFTAPDGVHGLNVLWRYFKLLWSDKILAITHFLANHLTFWIFPRGMWTTAGKPFYYSERTLRATQRFHTPESQVSRWTVMSEKLPHLHGELNSPLVFSVIADSYMFDRALALWLFLASLGELVLFLLVEIVVRCTFSSKWFISKPVSFMWIECYISWMLHITFETNGLLQVEYLQVSFF